LSKFEANPDGFATGFGEAGIVEAMITKENIYRECKENSTRTRRRGVLLRRNSGEKNSAN
jgi:hypothetical protein